MDFVETANMPERWVPLCWGALMKGSVAVGSQRHVLYPTACQMCQEVPVWSVCPRATQSEELCRQRQAPPTSVRHCRGSGRRVRHTS